MPRGYEEGPVAEEAEARRDALERGESIEPAARPEDRRAVYGSTEDDPETHFIGWLDDVDPDALFDSGGAWGIQIVRTKR